MAHYILLEFCRDHRPDLSVIGPLSCNRPSIRKIQSTTLQKYRQFFSTNQILKATGSFQ